MKYWDASAIVPVVVAEAGTDEVRRELREDPGVITWALTRVEFVSALERRVREGSIDRGLRRQILSEFEEFSETWDEVTDVLAVRKIAQSLLARHPLRAADAMQLAAAVLVREHAGSLGLVCLDERLATAAELEGFTIDPSPLW